MPLASSWTRSGITPVPAGPPFTDPVKKCEEAVAVELTASGPLAAAAMALVSAALRLLAVAAVSPLVPSAKLVAEEAGDDPLAAAVSVKLVVVPSCIFRVRVMLSPTAGCAFTFTCSEPALVAVPAV